MSCSCACARALSRARRDRAIGTSAVQLLKYAGAWVVATSTTANVELVRTLGADAVVDWEREDFRALDERFDAVFDAVGKSSFGPCCRLLRESSCARLERGELSPVIDRTYVLDDIVAAFQYVETGRKTGNVVVRVE